MVRDKPTVLYVDDMSMGIGYIPQDDLLIEDLSMFHNFYTSVKILGKIHAPTLYFNILIIWIMTFLLPIYLRFSLLKKSI